MSTPIQSQALPEWLEPAIAQYCESAHKIQIYRSGTFPPGTAVVIENPYYRGPATVHKTQRFVEPHRLLVRRADGVVTEYSLRSVRLPSEISKA